MPQDSPRRHATTRRTVLAAAGTTLAGLSVGVGGAHAEITEQFVLEQDGECYPVTPLDDGRPVVDFYDWGLAEKDYSSTNTADLQREDTSLLFLYQGPDGLSLVVVHGKYVEEDYTDPSEGGSVSFDFEGLPADGKWVVQDDHYDGSTNYDQWSRDGSSAEVDWTWAGNRTDGGAFCGLDGPANSDDVTLELTITPAFNNEAELHGEYYDGEVTDWQLLSGSVDDPDRHSLRLDEPVTIRYGSCATGTVTDSDEETTTETKTDTPSGAETEDEKKGTDHDEAKGNGHKDSRDGRGFLSNYLGFLTQLFGF